MNVIGHNFQRQNLDTHLFGLTPEYLLQACLNRPDEDWSPSFRTPNQMIIQEIDVMLAVPVFHVDRLAHIKTESKGRLTIHPPAEDRGLSGQERR